MEQDPDNTEDTSRALVAKGSGTSLTPIAGAGQRLLTRMNTDVLPFTEAEKAVLAKTLRRLGRFEFCEEDYQQLQLWARERLFKVDPLIGFPADLKFEPSPDVMQKIVKNIIACARRLGHIGQDLLNDMLPPDKVSAEQVEDVVSMLSDMDIKIIKKNNSGEFCYVSSEDLASFLESAILAFEIYIKVKSITECNR